MLSPRKTKWRKQMKQARHLRGKETRGTTLAFGEYGLQALDSLWVKSTQIEAGRRSITRFVKKNGKLWIRVFPDKPISRKPAETRMGSGKGSPEFWVAEVRAGRILYEITGCSEAEAKEAFELAAAKLPIRVRIVKRSDFLV